MLQSSLLGAPVTKRLFSTVFEPILFPNLHGKDSWHLSAAQERGDWTHVDEWMSLTKEDIIQTVKDSNLRGRGGAGFSTGLKWSFMPNNTEEQHFLVINGDEGEPGTSKDRYIMLHEPHKLLEGCLAAAKAVGAHDVYIYVRGEFRAEIARLNEAIKEAEAAGFIGTSPAHDWPLSVHVHPGAGAYVCGEETALLNSLEGKSGRPRLKPPYPAQKGLWGMPTTVNNVETIASVPSILRGEWQGPDGRKIVTVSGHVRTPGYFESPMGAPLKDIVEHAGGVCLPSKAGTKRSWVSKRIKPWTTDMLALVPGGLSCVPLTPAEVRTATLSYEDLSARGTALGTAGVIVLSEETDLLKWVSRLAHFYKLESCGQCSPCREGTAAIAHRFDQLREGVRTREEAAGALRDIYDIASGIPGTTICALGPACADPVMGYINKFGDRLEEEAMRNFK
eukprot:gnl/Dysnectes_brevis/2267_a2657_1164.p1 GENE.gnl/Dysnectes_brevis/2267_a2657_1164~~gnl/Dysnectes_brevis/2267_a2657_1164.p1  ORF type:complete len:474 (+),score=136.59 gnl/Dysnectes_brevis/2267_a2657_1164:77-1423(+)